MEYLDTASSLENALDFEDAEIEIVRCALKTKLFRRDEPAETRQAKFQVMLSALSDKFGIPEVRLEMSSGDWLGWSYAPEANKIVAARYSLVSILDGFAEALLYWKNRDVAAGEPPHLAFPVLAFGLSAFKQAAPQMFAEAKMNGRLVGTSVDYTDGGRLSRRRGARELPDIDPENRRPGDRGNGVGED